MSEKTLRERFMVRFVGMTRYSRWVAWAVVAFYMILVLGGIALGDYLLSLPLSWMSVLLMVLTALFIGTRLRGINNIVHECSHSSFSEHRGDNVLIGKTCSAILTGCFRTYKDDHLSHHAHLGNYEHDHEFAAIEKFRLHEPLTPRSVLRHFITPLTGQHLKMYSGVNLSGRDGNFFFGVKLALLVAIVAFAIVNPLTAIFFVLLPLFYIFPTLNFWTDCLDHAGICGAEDGLDASRNVIAPAPVRLLFFPRNDCYHLVHHLFPQVPARHLKVAHDELCNDPEYAAQPLAVRPTHRGFADLFREALPARNRVDMRNQES